MRRFFIYLFIYFKLNRVVCDAILSFLCSHGPIPLVVLLLRQNLNILQHVLSLFD